MTKRTRYTITIVTTVFLMVVTFFAIFKDMETLAITCVTAITGACLGYIWGESKRPSGIN